MISRSGYQILVKGLSWVLLCVGLSLGGLTWAEDAKNDEQPTQADPVRTEPRENKGSLGKEAASDPADGSDDSLRESFSFWASPDGFPPLSEKESKKLFPVYPIVAKQQQFWISVFSKYNSKQGLLHDGLVGLPTYGAVNLRGLSKRSQERLIRTKKKQVSNNLLALANAIEKGQPLSKKQRLLRNLFPKKTTAKQLKISAGSVRFQRGLSDKFRKGLERSSSVLVHARSSMRKHGVPADLAFLPHVESSFQVHSYSNKNAAGMWQFTRGTARLYMTVNYTVDERLDPIIASDAAARFLKENYKKLKTWPLAITAYNHGPYSLKKIVARQGTRNLGKLIENYHGGLFKIASKNFYAEFLAARTIALNPEAYFPGVKRQPVLDFQEQQLPFYLDAKLASKLLNTSKSKLRALNPALRHPVWSGSKLIPTNYKLRFPSHIDAQKFLASVPQKQRFAKQQRTWVVRVRSGDTLSSIGRKYKISWHSIAKANNIVSYNRLRPGQKLLIPHRGQTAPPQIKKIQQNIQLANAKKQGKKQGEKPATKTKTATTSNFIYPSKHANVLQVLAYSPSSAEVKVKAVYGEVIGHYADWSGTGLTRILRANRLSRRAKLKANRQYRIPLNVSKQEFERRRITYHAQLESDFFQRFNVIDKKTLIVKPGQTAWNIAKPHNIPMWLFFRENPRLQNKILQPGMKLVLPIVTPIKSQARVL